MAEIISMQAFQNRREFAEAFGPTGLNWQIDDADLAMRIVRDNSRMLGNQTVVDVVALSAELWSRRLVNTVKELELLAFSYVLEKQGWDRVLDVKG